MIEVGKRYVNTKLDAFAVLQEDGIVEYGLRGHYSMYCSLRRITRSSIYKRGPSIVKEICDWIWSLNSVKSDE